MSILIQAHTANEALPLAVQVIHEQGYFENSRNGGAWVAPGTFITDYTHPHFRVLFSQERDANPFFHLFEAMWMLAGRKDLAFVKSFAKNIESFSVDGETLHAAYGYRWRRHFSKTDHQTGLSAEPIDQLAEVIKKLVECPSSRQVVLGIWDPAEDLVDSPENARDRACNLGAVFTPRPIQEQGVFLGYRLDMTVYNRSNDVVWGAYGANYVHFGFLHEFVSSAAGMHIGLYTQVGANTHIYTEHLYGEKLHSAITSQELRGISVSPDSLYSGKKLIIVSKDNLYVADKPARSLSMWGWSVPNTIAASQGENTFNTAEGLEMRRRTSAGMVNGLQSVDQLLSDFLDHRRRWDEATASSNQLAVEDLDHLEFRPSPGAEFLFVSGVVVPMFKAHELHRRGHTKAAILELQRADNSVQELSKSRQMNLLSLGELLGCPDQGFVGVRENKTGLSVDWFIAGCEWLERRKKTS